MSLHPYFVVRAAGLEVRELDALRTPATARRLGVLVELGEWLRTEGAAISDALHPVIGATAEGKPLLVALRRAVFQCRAPEKLLERTEQLLPVAELERIRHWARQRESRDQLAAELPDLVRADLADAVAGVRELASRPDLQRGLLVSSPALLADLWRWLQRPAQLPADRVLATLVRYLVRMAVKTSPRSTFTSVGLGSWGPTVRCGCSEVVTEVHAGFLTGLIDRLGRRPDVAGHLGVRVNPSLTVDGDLARFLSPPPGCRVLTIRMTPEVTRCLELARSGTLAASPLTDQLVDLGAVQTFVPVPDQAPDRLSSLVSWLESTPGGGAERLRAVDELSRSYRETDDAAQCAGLLDAISSELSQAAAESGLTAQRQDDAARRTFLDNSVLATPVSLDPGLVPVSDIDALRPLLGLFDRGLATRRAVDRFVGARRIPFVTLFHAVHSDRLATDDPELKALRRKVTDEVTAAITTVDGVQHLDPGVLRELPRDAVPPSIAVYAQLPSPLLVVNLISGGHGRGRGRVRRLTGATSDPADSDGEIVAEFDHLFGNSLNSRAPETAFSIDYPGEVPSRPHDRRIPLGELVVHGDPLRLLWRGRPVRPVHTGMLSPSLLPPAARFLVEVFGTAPYLLGSHHPVLRPWPQLGDSVVRQPRLRVGDVVVRRTSWTLRRETMPPLSADWQLRMLEWLRANDIPSGCFVRAGRPQMFAKENKPLYVDFTNWFHVLAVRRMLSGSEGIVRFEEALPIPAGRVLEYVFEVEGAG